METPNTMIDVEARPFTATRHFADGRTLVRTTHVLTRVDFSGPIERATPVPGAERRHVFTLDGVSIDEQAAHALTAEWEAERDRLRGHDVTNG